jgi:hypothetical protein
MTWFQPRKGKFNVTDKGDLLDQTFFDWRIVQPHLIAMALLAGALSVGWIKLLFFSSVFNIQIDSLVLNTAWAGFSLIILTAAVSVARETRQARQDIRIHAELPVLLYLKTGHVISGVTRTSRWGRRRRAARRTAREGPRTDPYRADHGQRAAGHPRPDAAHGARPCLPALPTAGHGDGPQAGAR